jgi:hypothetical protein
MVTRSTLNQRSRRKLRELYDGDLHFPTSPALRRPFVIANFVSTLDGVVSYEIKGIVWRLNHQWFQSCGPVHHGPVAGFC